jgi:hypothetical protein
MSTQRIFISNRSQAVLVCQQCGATKTVNVEPESVRGKPVRVNCKSCGHSFEVVFDTRSRYRKGTALKGHYFGKAQVEDQSGHLVISNLSLGGLKFQPKGKTTFAVGDSLTIEFTLDDPHKTPIRTEAVVKSVMDQDIGVEFTALDEHTRKILGFYLMP